MPASEPRQVVTHPQSAGRRLREQVAHSCVELWRARVVAVFTLVLPLVWLVVIGILAGNETVESGVRVMQFVTPVAIAMGVLYAAFPTVAISMTQARELGTLKRVRGTPMPVRVFVAGRIAGAAAFALAAVAVVLVIAVAAYDVQVVWRTLPATVVTLVVGTACFAAIGVAFSVLSPSTAVAQAGSIATAVVLTFVSGMFTLGGAMPPWLDTVGDALPLKPFTEALQEQFNPFHTGAGWDLGALALMTAWGLAAGLVAVRWFGRTRAGTHTARGGSSGAGSTEATSAARTTPTSAAAAPPPRAVVATRYGALTLVAGQVTAAVRSIGRDAGAVFFALVMPIGLYALMVTLQGPSFEVRPGVRFADFFAAGMVTWGTAVTAFMNLPESVATARDRRVLKRLRGTPLRPWHYLVGRTTGWFGLVLLVAAGVLLTGRLAYDVRPTLPGLLLGVAVLALGTVSLAACGFVVAALVRDARAVGAVGLVVLLPLAFFSDVFVNDVPEWMERVGALFPLKHLQNALAAAWDPAGASVGADHLAVMLLWAVGAGLVALRRFRWEPPAAARTEGARGEVRSEAAFPTSGPELREGHRAGTARPDLDPVEHELRS